MTTIDLLVFGPHPDDIEIGFGGAVALHAAPRLTGRASATSRGASWGPTAPSRIASPRPKPPARCSGPSGASTSAGPTAASTRRPSTSTTSSGWSGPSQPRVVAIPYWNDRHPDHRAASETLSRAVFKAGLRRFEPGARAALETRNGVCYYFINDDAPVSFGLDVSEVYDKKRQALACHGTQFTPSGPDSVPTRLTGSTFRQLIESRDAQLGALTGVAFAEGVVVREPMLRADLFNDQRPR